MTCSCPVCGGSIAPSVFNFDPDSGIVVSQGRFVQLPRREAHVLEFLIERKGRMVSKSILFDELYRQDDEPDSQDVIESHVSKLRKKVRPLGITIISERFKGYMLTTAGAA